MIKKSVSVLVLDGQGGGIGKSIISALKNLDVEAEIVCAGTNAYASNKMYAAGADRAVQGEDGIEAAIRAADIIAGPIGIIIPGALKGEISKRVATCVADSKAVKVLIPLNKCSIIIAGVNDRPLAENIEEVAKDICKRCKLIALGK